MLVNESDAVSFQVRSIIMEAFTNAAFLCEEYYKCAPDIEIKGNR